MSASVVKARYTVEVGAPGQRFVLEADFDLEQGVLVFFGPSGAGKSLALQALAGLIEPTRGRIEVGGEVLFDGARRLHVPAHRRRIGYVPQHKSLFPFRDVMQNVSFGLPRSRRRGEDPEVCALLAELGIEHLARARPAALSGGERQRVALARALAVKPRLLLLDEPFASIDVNGRAELRAVLKRVLSQRGTPAVFVTHDPDEALAVGDRLLRFERGRTTEAGPPAGLLRRGQAVRITGRPEGAPRETSDGRSTLALGGARIEAPTELLSTNGGEEIDLELRTRPRSPRTGDTPS